MVLSSRELAESDYTTYGWRKRKMDCPYKYGVKMATMFQHREVDTDGYLNFSDEAESLKAEMYMCAHCQ
jgi:hypothetical protein